MEFNDINKGRFADVKPGEKISNGNPEPMFKAGEATVKNIEQSQAYNKRVLEYAQQYNIKVAPTLEIALKGREAGEITMTLRELDVAARLKVPLDKDFIYKALRAFGGMIIDGIPGEYMEGKLTEKNNIYFLRTLYNRGVKFKTKGGDGKSDYDKSTPQKQAEADKAMRDILDKMDSHNLPAWPEEIEKGFSTELCKPEWMTWDQFNKAQSIPIRRYGTGEHQGEADPVPVTGTGAYAANPVPPTESSDSSS